MPNFGHSGLCSPDTRTRIARLAPVTGLQIREQSRKCSALHFEGYVLRRR